MKENTTNISLFLSLLVLLASVNTSFADLPIAAKDEIKLEAPSCAPDLPTVDDDDNFGLLVDPISPIPTPWVTVTSPSHRFALPQRYRSFLIRAPPHSSSVPV